MTLVVRRVDHAVASDRGRDVVQVLVLSFDFSQDGVQRMLERAVNRITLGGLEFIQVGVYACPRLAIAAAIAKAALEVLDDLLSGQNSLGDVIDHFAAGDQATPAGHRSPLTSPLIAGFALTDSDKSDLIAFLEALTDDSFLSNPKHQSPFH